jgi:hypothetical protein
MNSSNTRCSTQIGDLYLLGHPLLAAFSAHKSGHALNNALARALLDRPDSLGVRQLRGSCELAPADRLALVDLASFLTGMWLLRLLAVLTVLTVAGGVLAFLFTRNARYLQFFAWRLFRYSLIVALLVFALMILERVASFLSSRMMPAGFRPPCAMARPAANRSMPSIPGWFWR